MLFTLSLLSAPFIKGMYNKMSCLHAWSSVSKSKNGPSLSYCENWPENFVILLMLFQKSERDSSLNLNCQPAVLSILQSQVNRTPQLKLGGGVNESAREFSYTDLNPFWSHNHHLTTIPLLTSRFKLLLYYLVAGHFKRVLLVFNYNPTKQGKLK